MKPVRREKMAPRRSTPAGGHRPVMLPEVVQVLDPRPGDVAVDCTVGMAGHARAILQRVGPQGRLVGLDLDHESLTLARQTLGASGTGVSLHAGNFAALPQVLAREQLDGVDVLIADLGMSSVQVDDPDRGFSYVRDGPLDMRMDRTRGRTAAEILGTIRETELADVLHDLADEPHAREIAGALIAARNQSQLTSTSQLARIIGETLREPVSREGGWRLRPDSNQWRSNPASRTFQALRMLVNRELPSLQELLRVLPHCLRPSGRAAIISFHSGEDRIVKGAFRDGLERGLYDEVCDAPLRADYNERLANPRSRSAKLRWARRSQSVKMHRLL
jgi:16S rRNA (cytosine1402-N4)-methyltransferase